MMREPAAVAPIGEGAMPCYVKSSMFATEEAEVLDHDTSMRRELPQRPTAFGDMFDALSQHEAPAASHAPVTPVDPRAHLQGIVAEWRDTPAIGGSQQHERRLSETLQGGQALVDRRAIATWLIIVATSIATIIPAIRLA